MTSIKFESELINYEPLRRVVIELPEDRALALSRVLNQYITWNETRCFAELSALHRALGEDWAIDDTVVPARRKSDVGRF